MTEPEELAGFDDGGKDPAAPLRTLATPPSVPAASSPELKTLVGIAMGAIVVATL